MLQNPVSGDLLIRELHPDEWQLFRDFRLAALQATPGVYGTRYEEAVGRSEEQWRNTVRGASNQSFGLFDRGKLVAITSVFTWAEDASGETAILASSFILDTHRGRGLSRMLYDARLEWIRARAHFKRVVVGHRLSNEASRRANQHYPFRPFRRESHAWPDGTVEDEVYYEMRIGE
jgi:GNAT superfamily N-acetyltransferase